MAKAFRNRLFVTGIAATALLCMMALFGRALCPNDPLAVDFQSTLAPMGGRFPLGTDNLGRCVLSRLLTGARATLGSALAVEAFIFMLGLLVGVISGYFGGVADGAATVAIDTLLAFPSMILALVIAGLLGPGLKNLIIAMCCVHWVGHARVARNLARSVRSRTFVLASRAAGSGHMKIIFRRVLPHILPQMIMYSALNISSVIIGISSMSFIGLGVRPPEPEWGAILYEARAYMDTNPTMMVTAMVCILLAVAGFQCIGESLRDILSVRAGKLGTEKRRSQ
ncbi:MAG: ABC transporter permease subunit [Oscillospiraceae bacterium]|nr:ABC transporter permease subunit [Oscillospiraceae bacterium]